MAIGFPVKDDYVTGEVLTATNMNDLSGSVNLLESAQYAAGKNAIINGAFNVWQRGTSFAPSAAGFYYTSDRWVTYNYATSATTVSQQAFTAGTAPVPGYESQYFLRINSTNTSAYIEQRIEDVRTFAGQTATLSFWAKSASSQTLATFKLYQAFGSGGSSNVDINGTAPTITTSWARYSYTFTVPSIAGKTIGAGSSLTVALGGAINNNLDIWGVQLEEGSTASAFQTATGTIQGELAACQRYYTRINAGSVYTFFCNGNAYNTTVATCILPLPVTLRVSATSIDTSGTASHYRLINGSTATACSVVPALDQAATQSVALNFTVASGLTTGQAINAGANNTASAYIGVNAEL